MQLLRGLHGAFTALTTLGSLASQAGGPDRIHILQPDAGARASEETPAFLAFATIRKEITDVFRQSPRLDGPHRAVGMNRETYALVFSLASGLSLPIGAWLGVKLSPVLDRDVAAMMAFGAGCLLFAVTVELYAHTLSELEHGRIGYREMAGQTGAAVVGAYFYVWTNRMLSDWFEEPGSNKTGTSPRRNNQDVEEMFRPEAYQKVMQIEQDQDTMREEMSMGKLISMREDKLQECANDSPASTPDPKKRARLMWKRIRMTFHLRTFLAFWREESVAISGLRGREKGLRVLANEFIIAKRLAKKAKKLQRDGEGKTSAEAQNAKKVALALFLGLLIDGVPEGILMGFLAAEGHLSPVLIISLLVANFPEAFSSASLLVTAGMSLKFIVALWTGLAVLVGCLSGLSCTLLLWMYPKYGQPGEELPQSILISIAGVEGLTGGAMIACIASVMLPEAFERAGKAGPLSFSSGFLTTVGFLVATVLKAVGG